MLSMNKGILKKYWNRRQGTMEDDETYLKQTLHQCNYRQLQQLAKSMSLPCNFKKVYLIEVIWAKKFSSDTEVNSLVQRIKIERQQLAEIRKAKKKINFMNKEVYYIKPPSPPITTTPKRTGLTMCCHPDLCQSILKYKPKQALVQGNQKTYTSPKTQNGSDRVLRSNNFKTMNKKAAINNTVFGVCPKDTPIEIASHHCKLPNFKVFNKEKYLIRKYKPSILGLSNSNSDRTCLNRQTSQANNKTPLPAKRQTTVSGIYPLFPKEMPTKLDYLQSIGRDGKISKIHALVQKRSLCNENYEILNVHKQRINLQDIINCKVDAQIIANSNMMEFMLADANMNNNYLQLQHPILPSLDKDIQCNLEVSHQINIRANEIVDPHSVYYHKKTKEDQVRCNRFLNTREQYMENDRLPKINEVFTQFRDITRPLYVQAQANEKSETINMLSRNNTNLGLLENIVNFRSQYLFNQPLLKMATTLNTKCVFSTSTVATPKVQPSSTVVFDEPFMSSGERVTGGIPGAIEHYEQEVKSPETCSSIPEMVEDALEVISQDGDYMERIGMDESEDCMPCLMGWSHDHFGVSHQEGPLGSNVQAGGERVDYNNNSFDQRQFGPVSTPNSGI